MRRQIQWRAVALAPLLLLALLAGCSDTTVTVNSGGASASSASSSVPGATATPAPAQQSAPRTTSATGLVFNWHAALGQGCAPCGTVYVHAPWKLAFRCPADPPGVGGYGIWFNLSSSNGTTQDPAHAPAGCTGGKQWLQHYSDMPTVGSGSYLSLDEASCPDPRVFDVSPSVDSCDIWIYQE